MSIKCFYPKEQGTDVTEVNFQQKTFDSINKNVFLKTAKRFKINNLNNNIGFSVYLFNTSLFYLTFVLQKDVMFHEVFWA
jgi:hypothetical protein